MALLTARSFLTAGNVHQALDLVGFHLVGIGDALDFFLKLLVGGLDVLLGNDGFHGQTHLDLLFGLLTELLLELVLVHAHILQILLQLQALLRMRYWKSCTSSSIRPSIMASGMSAFMPLTT